ncbi:MAG: heparinase II/III family protein [Planctomycetota bacterium]|nr:heparinase II/III family protein [Planctomycetota bacterium]
MLLCLAGGAQSADTPLPGDLLKRLVEQTDGLVKAGEKPKVWIEIFGKKTEVQVKSADAKSLTVLIQGNPLPLSWEKISLPEIAGIASSTAGESGARLLLAGEIALAAGNHEQANSLLGKALAADPNLSEQIKAAAAKLPSALEAPPPPKPLKIRFESGGGQANAGTGSGTASPADPNAGATATVMPKRDGQGRTERPRVLFDAARLAAVRARAGNPDGKRFLGYLAGNGNQLSTEEFALAYVMTGDAKHAAEAIDRVEKNIIPRGVITNLNSSFPAMACVATVYDWCHDKLTDDQKKKWREWIAKEYEAMKPQYVEGYHNYGVKAAHAFALCGYALRGDDALADDLLKEAYEHRWQQLILPACKAGNAGGAWSEGEGYGTTTAAVVMELAEAARCADGKDLASAAPEFFVGRLAYMMFLDMPTLTPDGGHRLWINGDMHRRRNWDDALQQRLELQEMLKGTDLAAYAQEYAEAKGCNKCQYNSMNWIDVMWRDRAQPRKPLDTFKLSHLAVGRGTVLMRSDWTENATHVGYVAGPLLSSHTHSDAGHFTIWKHGELATNAGDYRGTGKGWALDAYIRTVAHNSLLIYDPAEKMRARHENVLNDGGQLGYDGTEGRMSGAKIVAYDARRSYTYICSDLTDAYAKTKVTAVRRQLVYLRPDTVVIVDRVASTNPAFPKIWQCYLAGNAKAEEKVFRTDNGKARLRADVLLPADAQVKLLGGQDKAVDVFGTKVPQPPGGNGSDDGPAWRAEVRPGAARADDLFVVVLRAYETAEPPAATVKADGNTLKFTIPGAGELVMNADGTPGGSYNGKAFATGVVPQEE